MLKHAVYYGSVLVQIFGNISQISLTIQIIFGIQLLFTMRRDDAKFSFGLKTIKQFFRGVGIGEARSATQNGGLSCVLIED